MSELCCSTEEEEASVLCMSACGLLGCRNLDGMSELCLFADCEAAMALSKRVRVCALHDCVLVDKSKLCLFGVNAGRILHVDACVL